MLHRYFNLNDPDVNPNSCTHHDCDTKNDKRFPFWMHKLPSHLKPLFLAHTLSNLQSSVSSKSGVIASLPRAAIPGMTARLLEQVASNDNSLSLRRDAFMSLKIIISLRAQVIFDENILSTIFQEVLNIQHNSARVEVPDSLSLEDIYRDSPVIEALELIHHIGQTFPAETILEQLHRVFSDHIKSSEPLRRFYGLMAFTVSTGPCVAQLLPLSIEVLDEIVKSYHQQCPLVDFALSILISSWRCRPLLFQRCIILRASLIPIFISSIRQYTSRGSDIIWATTSCLGLDVLLESAPIPPVHIENTVDCLLTLIWCLLQGGHDQPMQIMELPVESLGYTAISAGKGFSPYLTVTMEVLKDLSSNIPLSGYEMVHLTAGGLIGDCIKAVGGAIRPHHAFSVERISTLGESADPLLRMMAFRVLTGLTLECPGIMSPYMGQLIPMLLNSIRRAVPNVQSLKENLLMIAERTHAISSFNHLATTGSILFKFVGTACFLNMLLLGHNEIAVRIKACDFLLDQVLWDHAAPPLRIQGALRHYVAYYIRRLDRGIYINSDARIEHQRSAKIERALAFVQSSPQPLIKVHPTSHAPGDCFM